MFVSEIMSTCVAECTEDTSLNEVYELIQKCDHGLVVVVESNVHRVPLGVVNERSICEQVIARGRNPRSLHAGSVMVSTIKTVSETDLVQELRSGDLSSVTAVVVTDGKRQVRGLILPEKLSRMETRAPEIVFVPENNEKRRRRVSEIPAFGWA